jgi:hypothetical protein
VLFTLQSSWELIALICFFLILLIIIYATLMFVSERGDWDPVLGEYVRQDEPGVSFLPTCCRQVYASMS